MTFQQSLQVGFIGESVIASWLRSRGFFVMPVYEVEQSRKGPRLFAPHKRLIAPDMLVFTADKTIWIEAKNKNAFSWHRKTSQWVTGIDIHHYNDYCEIDDSTPFPVWLMFLQQGGHAKDSPEHSPSGLFGNKLSYLRKHENHRFEGIGNGGMVYWSIEYLRLLAHLSELKPSLANDMQWTSTVNFNARLN